MFLPRCHVICMSICPAPMSPKLAALAFVALPFFVMAQQSKIDSALNIANRHTHDTVEVKTLTWLGNMTTASNTQKAIEFYHRAISVFETYTSGTSGVVAYLRLARHKNGLGEHDSATFFLQKAKTVLDRFPAHNKKLDYEFYNVSGIINKNLGNYDDALRQYTLAEQLGEKVIGKDNLAGAYLNMANVYSLKGDAVHTQDYLFKSLKIFENIRNDDGMAYCYNGLGNLFNKQKNYAKAEYYLKKSLDLKEKSGNKKAITTGLMGLGVVYLDSRNYSLATEYIDKTIRSCEEYKLKDLLCQAYINKGMICYQQNNLPDAQTFYLKAKTLAEELQSKALLASVNAELGQVYHQQADHKKALHTLLNGVEQARQSHNLDAEHNAHHALAQYYYTNKQYKEAYDEYDRFFQQHDSLQGSTITERLYNLEAKYESEKKQRQIELLKKDQQLKSIELERERTIEYAVITFAVLLAVIGFLTINRYRFIQRSKRLAAIERMRFNVARDLHDNVGSTLSSINIISQVALSENKPENFSNHFRRIGEQSQKMMENMSDMVWSINPTNDSIEKVMIRMKEFCAEILEPKNIGYTFRGEEVFNGIPLDVEKRKNLFLIFKEAINNAAKYSGATVIEVRLCKTENGLSLIIHDDGKGFVPDAVRNGNGLRNMGGRAEEIGGKTILKTAPGAGTTVEFQVPLT